VERILTSWKEIAQYVGKGVRTVQRWERDIEFPVRRPNHGSRGVVLALPEEIDAWVHAQNPASQNNGSSESEIARLRKDVTELWAENHSLRQELEAAQRTVRANAALHLDLDCVSATPTRSYGDFLAYCDHLLRTSALLQQQYGETIERSKELCFLLKKRTTHNSPSAS